MACGNDCERSDWLFGVAGVCDNVTLVCVCPEGFTGKDDWQDFNSCHLDERVLREIREWYFGLNVAFVFFMLTSFMITAVSYNSFTELKDAVFGAYQSMRNIRRTVSRDSALTEEGKRTSRLQRVVVAAAFCFVLFPVFELFYTIPAVFNDPPRHRYDLPLFQDVGYGLGLSCFFIGFYLLTYVWYFTLPDIGMLGKMYKVNSIVLTFPTVVPMSIYLHVPLVLVFQSIVHIIIPNVAFDDIELRNLMMSIGNYFAIYIGFELLIGNTILAVVLIRVFTAVSNKHTKLKGSVRLMEAVLSARTSIYIWWGVSIVVGSAGITAVSLMEFTDFGRHHIHLVLFTISAATRIGSVGATCAFLRLTRKRKSTRISVDREPSELSSMNGRLEGSGARQGSITGRIDRNQRHGSHTITEKTRVTIHNI